METIINTKLHTINKSTAKCRKLISTMLIKIPSAERFDLKTSNKSLEIPKTNPDQRQAIAPVELSFLFKIPSKKTTAIGGEIYA